MPDLEELPAKLKVLSDAYAAQLPEKLEQIEKAWHDLPRAALAEGTVESVACPVP